MKLHVVYNERGDILGAALMDSKEGVQARPIANEQASQRAAEIFVPIDYRDYDVAAICERFRVDTEGKFAELKPKA